MSVVIIIINILMILWKNNNVLARLIKSETGLNSLTIYDMEHNCNSWAV